MLYFTQHKGDCTGCSACVSVCPTKCITLETDDEGFLYPMASDACINCGKCQKVCPIEDLHATLKPLEIEQKAYCAVTKSKAIWRRSASGGAFSEICRAWGDDRTIVCGAAWDGLTVHHVCIEGVESISPLCKSKYVASAPENVFLEIKEHLKSGKKVIFSGTPCQVAGLNRFLKKSYSNLLTIDLICHGVGSPKVFTACMDVIGDQFEKKVVGYEFRTKKYTHTTDHLQQLKTKESNIILDTDPYIQLFLSQTCLRPSCGDNCRFRDERRQGDITIADFKGLLQVFPSLKGTKRNYSSIIVNTTKGASIINSLNKTMEIYECPIDEIKKYNPLFFRQTWASATRDSFFVEFKQMPYETIKRYTQPATLYKESYKRKLYNALPVFVRSWLLALYRGGANVDAPCSLSSIIFTQN